VKFDTDNLQSIRALNDTVELDVGFLLIASASLREASVGNGSLAGRQNADTHVSRDELLAGSENKRRNVNSVAVGRSYY